MMKTGAELRQPSTTWDHAVSVADQLVLWHGEAEPRVIGEPLRLRLAVLLGAVIQDCAREAGLDGPGVLAVPLARVSEALRIHAASVREGAPAPAGTGDEFREQLLAEFGSDAFEEVWQAALEVVDHHLSDTDAAVEEASIGDRRPALREQHGRRQCERLAALEGDH